MSMSAPTSRPVIDIQPLGSHGRKLLAELFGSFMLVFSVAQVGDITDPKSNIGSPLTAGLTLAFLVFQFGPVSGAHFNPAVSAATRLCGYSDNTEFFTFVLTQLFGGFLGAMLSWYAGNVESKFFPYPHPSSDSSAAIGRAFIVEMVGTLFLAHSVLQTAYSRSKNNSYFGLAIGLALFSTAAASGRISGAALNPAVTTGLQLVACFATGDCTHLKFWPVYVIAEFVGAALAFVLYSLTGQWADGDGPAFSASLPLLPSAASSSAETAGSVTSTTDIGYGSLGGINGTVPSLVGKQ